MILTKIRNKDNKKMKYLLITIRVKTAVRKSKLILKAVLIVNKLIETLINILILKNVLNL